MMKRLTICVLAMMAICVQAFATDITGKWKTTLEDDGTEIPCVITVTKSDILFSVDMEEDDDEIGLISMSIKIPATYTIVGNKLNITAYHHSAHLFFRSSSYINSTDVLAAAENRYSVGYSLDLVQLVGNEQN